MAPASQVGRPSPMPADTRALGRCQGLSGGEITVGQHYNDINGTKKDAIFGFSNITGKV